MANPYAERENRRGGSATLRWALGVALFISLSAALFSLQAFQLSGSGTAKPALKRAIDALAEGDAVIARQYDGLQAAAADAEPGDSIPIADYPIAIALPQEEIAGASIADIHARALERATDRLYRGGTEVIRDPQARGGPGRFSSAGVVDEFLGLLTENTRTVTTYATAALVGLSAALAVALALACTGYSRMGAPGVALAAASAVVMGAGAAAWLYANSADDGEYVRSELMAIAGELAILPVRNGAALLGLGAVLAVGGFVASRVAAAYSERDSRVV